MGQPAAPKPVLDVAGVGGSELQSLELALSFHPPGLPEQLEPIYTLVFGGPHWYLKHEGPLGLEAAQQRVEPG